MLQSGCDTVLFRPPHSLKKNTPSGAFQKRKNHQVFSAVPVSDFLSGAICSAQLEAASVKDRLGTYSGSGEPGAPPGGITNVTNDRSADVPGGIRGLLYI